MLWFSKKCFCVRFLNDAPQIHDGDLGRDMLDHSQIMGNNHISQIQFAPQILQ